MTTLIAKKQIGLHEHKRYLAPQVIFGLAMRIAMFQV